jgi:alcohol dehydrogenase class IV
MYSIVQPRAVHFGPGALQALEAEVSQFSPRRILAVTGPVVRRLGIFHRVLEAMGLYKDRVEVFLNPTPDPLISTVEECARHVRNGSFDLVIGVGGGSPMDVAKAAAILAMHEGGARDYLGRGLLKRRGLPTILIPTTSGTGTEVSQAAVMEVPEEGTRKSIWDPRAVPDAAIVEPDLSSSMPPALTADTGMDALYHAIEGFVSKASNPVARMYCREALGLIRKYLKRAYRNGSDMEAREGMSLAATLAGIGFSNGGLGAVHGFALALDSLPGFSHGRALAVLGPWVMDFNRQGHEEIYGEVANALGEPASGPDHRAMSRRACEIVNGLTRELGIPVSLRECGVRQDEVIGLAQKAFRLSQRLLPTNPRPVTEDDVLCIFTRAYEGEEL